MKTRCLLFSGINEVTLGFTELRPIGPNEVLIETEISCVSPGTELRCLAGQEISLGDHNFPFIPGYAAVGRVIETDFASRDLLGRRVFSSGNRGTASHRTAWGGHAAQIVAPADSVVIIPNSISSRDAALLKLAAIAYRGTRLAPASPGSSVLIIGLGPIGQLSARFYAAAGAQVVAVDVMPDRVAIAREAEIDAHLAPNDLTATIREKLPNGAAIVVDATGIPALLATSAALVTEKSWDDSSSPAGRLVVQGSYGSLVPLPPDICFARELSVLWPRDCQRSDLEQVRQLLEAKRISFRGLLDKTRPVSEASAIYQALREKTLGALTAGFSWTTN